MSGWLEEGGVSHVGVTGAVWADGRPQVQCLGQRLKHPVVDELIDRAIEGLDEEQQLWMASAIWHHYLGSWRSGLAYAPGVLVEHDGTIWAAEDETSGRPGEDPHWRKALECLSVMPPPEGRA